MIRCIKELFLCHFRKLSELAFLKASSFFAFTSWPERRQRQQGMDILSCSTLAVTPVTATQSHTESVAAGMENCDAPLFSALHESNSGFSLYGRQRGKTDPQGGSMGKTVDERANLWYTAQENPVRFRRSFRYMSVSAPGSGKNMKVWLRPDDRETREAFRVCS